MQAQEPYDVKVTNASGLTSTLDDQIVINSNRQFGHTATGTLALFGIVLEATQ